MQRRYGKKISDLAFSDFVRILKYEASKFGTLVIEVGRFFASSQLCHCCGYKNPQLKDLKVRAWKCPNCGAEHDRDRNAAINILREGLGQRPIQETESDFAITVINPFSCRKELAKERSFDLAGQWIFSPKEISARVKIFDAVISMNDSSVPINHGIRLLNLARSEIKNLIFVEANHQITDVQTQLEIADVLIKLHAGDFNFDSSNSCHVYKQRKNFVPR